MLADSGATTMVCDAAHHAQACELCGGSITVLPFDEVQEAPPACAPLAAPGPDSLAVILYTSGSTGRPKGVLHTHRSILAEVRNHSNGLRVTERDRWLLYASLSFANSVRTVYTSLLNGAALYPFDVKQRGFTELADWLIDNRITIIRGVPTFFRSFIASVAPDQRFPAVRILSLGGEPMLCADLRYFNRHFSPRCVLVHALGPTESLTVCWALVPHGTDATEGKLPIGRPLPDKEVLLRDESGHEAGAGEVGEIAVRSRYLSVGYWRDPERTRESFLPDPRGSGERIYLTGDLGTRAPDGTLIHVGRKDFQVKIRGFRIDVTEIENALLAVPGIREAVVVSRELVPGEPQLFAYFVAQPGPPVADSMLRAAIARALPDYMMPSVFVALDAMPRTPSGKTDRLRLPLPARGRDRSIVRAAPRSEVERSLAAMWADVLGLDEVGIDERFLELGGDSLQAARIAARVAAEWKIACPAAALLEAGTVAQMAEVIAAVQQGSAGAPDASRRIPRRAPSS
jgi:amino acid adenylation domain-containing protein